MWRDLVLSRFLARSLHLALAHTPSRSSTHALEELFSGRAFDFFGTHREEKSERRRGKANNRVFAGISLPILLAHKYWKNSHSMTMLLRRFWMAEMKGGRGRRDQRWRWLLSSTLRTHYCLILWTQLFFFLRRCRISFFCARENYCHWFSFPRMAFMMTFPRGDVESFALKFLENLK